MPLSDDDDGVALTVVDVSVGVTVSDPWVVAVVPAAAIDAAVASVLVDVTVAEVPLAPVADASFEVTVAASSPSPALPGDDFIALAVPIAPPPEAVVLATAWETLP